MTAHSDRVVIATNQSGVGRGLFDMVTLNAIHEKMMDALNRVGGRVDPDQAIWIEFLKGQNYCVGVARGYDEAVQLIEAYMRLGPFTGGRS